MSRKAPGLLLLLLGAALALIGGNVQSGSASGAITVRYGAICAAVGAILLVVGGADRRNARRSGPAAPAHANNYFYVSAIRSGYAAFVTGPYATPEQAAADVDRVRDLATEIGGVDVNHTYAWGVSESPVRIDGLANAQLGFQPVA